MAAFLSLYGGYEDLDGLLSELNHFEVVLDPQGCHAYEFYAYAMWCGTSFLLSLIGVALYVHDSSRWVLFRQIIMVPALIYTPVLFGFMCACISQLQTQEPGFAICMLVIEPILGLHVLRLLRDASRRGFNALVFDVPLGLRAWSFLLFSLAYHIGLMGCGAVLFGYANGPGRLLLALEASFRLRAVRPHPTVCPAGEVHTDLFLLGVCTFIVVGGHLTIRLSHAAAPYRAAWRVGVTAPIGTQGAVVALALLTCIDTQHSQELVLYAMLTGVQALALALVGNRAYSSAGGPARWLYVSLVPYHATTILATASCILWYASAGPLMSEEFVALWESVPPSGAVHFVFFSLCVLHLVALHSIVLFDPDEAAECEDTAVG